LSLATVVANAQIAFTPRISRYYDNTLQRVVTENLTFDEDIAELNAEITAGLQEIFGPSISFSTTESEIATNSNQVDLSLGGASLTVGLGNDRTQLAFTLLKGDGVTDAQQVVRQTMLFTLAGFETDDLSVASGSGHYDFERTDFEFTVQHRLNEGLSLIGGLRVEQTDLHYEATSQVQMSNNAINLLNLLLGGPISISLAEPSTMSVSVDGESTLYSLRFGAAAYVPAGERGLFYVSGLLQVSREEGESGTGSGATGNAPPTLFTPPKSVDETYYGPDISVGYVFRFGDHVDYDVRYRATAYFPESDSDNPRVNHGWSMGVSFWFGR
jgi:hypothetical protein